MSYIPTLLQWKATNKAVTNKVTFNGKVINLPKSVNIKFRDKLKVRHMMYAMFKQTKLYIMSLQHQNKLKYIQCALYLCSVQTNKKKIYSAQSQYKTVLCCYLHLHYLFVCLFVFLSICMSTRYSVPPPMGLSTAPYEQYT